MTMTFTAVTTLLILCTLLPFLPGPYDPLALPLSMMARVVGFGGLLLVPIGAFWTACGYWRPLEGTQHAFALAALIVSSFVWAAVSLAAFALGSLSLALICLALGVYVVFRVAPRVKGLTTAPSAARAPGLYLLVVPVAVFLLQRAVLEPAVEFSRNRAISNSAQLVADIEQYRATRGHYPPSLLSVHKDYSPAVIGIEKFHYEPSGKAFNLLFEQPASPLGTQEIVVYNPRGEQTATSHALDLLQFTPDRLERARGYYAVHDVPHTHWKYFSRANGFDLHAGRVVPAGQREQRERVCRYALRPPVAGDRLRVTEDGQVQLQLRHRWADGTTHVVFDPVEFLGRLAVLVPRPRINSDSVPRRAGAPGGVAG